MANVVKLGARPQTFKQISVPVELPDGSEGVIPVTYRYRTKTEFGAWLDETRNKAGQGEKKGKNKPADEFSWEAFYRNDSTAAAEQLLAAIDSWGLDIPLAVEALRQLDDEIPAASGRLFAAYGTACREGRLGN